VLLTETSLVGGRWFEELDEKVCIISNFMADILNVKVSDTLSFLGKNWTIVGIVDAEIFDQIKQIDGEQLTPLDNTLFINRVTHISMREIIIVPFEQLMKFGGYLTPYVPSVAILPNNASLTHDIAYQLFTKFSELFLYYCFEKNIYFFSSSTAYQVIGFQLQMIPILISGLMILNLMLATVYERTKEIFTLSSIGVSPFHIGFMFFAESNIYGLLGAIIGYIISMIFFRFNLFLPVETIFTNWSSSWVASIVGIVALITSAASIYPVIKASKLANPSLERVWKVSTKPSEREWEIPFPFIIENDVAIGLCFYLYEYVKGYSSEGGIFLAHNVKISQEDNELTVSMRVSLAPFETGVKQFSHMCLQYDDKTNKYTCILKIARESGMRDDWIRLNRQFIDAFRKQFLLWNSLKLAEKNEYVRKSHEYFDKSQR